MSSTAYTVGRFIRKRWWELVLVGTLIVTVRVVVLGVTILVNMPRYVPFQDKLEELAKDPKVTELQEPDDDDDLAAEREAWRKAEAGAVTAQEKPPAAPPRSLEPEETEFVRLLLPFVIGWLVTIFGCPPRVIMGVRRYIAAREAAMTKPIGK